MSSKQLTPKEQIEKKNILANKIMFIPIMCLLAVIPLIVRMVYVKPKDGRMNSLFGKVNLDDYYSQYKAVGIIVITVIMLVMTYLFIQKSEIKWDKYSKLGIISSIILFLMTALSTLFSDYKEIALWGVYDRAEGLVIWGCYIIMMLYTFYIVRDERGYKSITGALIFLVIVTAILGAFQYAGFDLLVKTEWGRNLIIPKEYREIAGSLSSDYDAHKVLGTLYHYDYVGSFGAMVVPLFAILLIMTKGVKEKIILGISTLAAIFVLLGSMSRAGLVGTGLALIAGLIIFGHKIAVNWKKGIVVGVVLIVILAGLNFITKGIIFSRIPTVFEDAMTLFKGTDKNFDYKDFIPVREIVEENGEVHFILQENELKLSFQNGELRLRDGQNNEVGYTVESSQYTTSEGEVIQTQNYTTSDERYSYISAVRQPIYVFTQQEPMDAVMVTVNDTVYGNDSGYFYFKLDETGVHAINSFSGEQIKYSEAKSVGFKGKEKIGSARGYIWSRSLAMFFSKNLLIGNGPDTYIAYFPNQDVLGKWWAYGATNITVDKPHNLYLQIAINQGGIALIAFLVLVGSYFIQSFKLYAFKKEYEGIGQAMGIGVMLAMIGYLGAAFFNDSIISVAPIFWILMGTGMAVNFINQKERLENHVVQKVISIKKHRNEKKA